MVGTWRRPVGARARESPRIQQLRESERCRTAPSRRVRVVRFLARRPVVAQTQLGPGDGHLVRAGGAHVWGEVDDATVVLHILEFVLLGGFHVDHRVLVYVLLQDHRLRGGKIKLDDLF